MVDDMENKQSGEKRISRSEFLRGAGAALAGATVVSVAGALAPRLFQTTPKPPQTGATSTPTPIPEPTIGAAGTASPVARLDAALIDLRADLTGATARNVHEKLGEYVSAGDFGAIPGGDGRENYAALSRALDAVAGTRATLLLQTGIYPLAGELLPKSDVTIAGNGMRGSIISAVENAPSIIGVRNANKVTIRDLGFTAEGKVIIAQAVNALGASDLLVERCWFDGMFHWSVYLGALSLRCGVVNSISEGTAQAHSIEINGSSYCYVINCHLKNSFGNGIEVYHNLNQECIGNRLIANHISGQKSGGILSHGEKYVAIIGNTITGTQSQGIRIARSEVVESYVAVGGTIMGNTVLDCGRSEALGIDLANDTLAWSVSGNTSKGSGSAGIGVFGAAHTVSGNVCIENARDGLLIGEGSHIISNNTCINNNAAGHNGAGVSGIYILSSGSSYMGNICTDTRAAKLQEYGVNVQGDNNTLTGNVTAGNKLGGVNDMEPNRGTIKTGNI